MPRRVLVIGPDREGAGAVHAALSEAGGRGLSVAAVGDARTAAGPAADLADARFVVVGVAAEGLDPAHAYVTDRGRLAADPRGELQRICDFLAIAYDQAMAGPLEALAREASGATGEAAFASQFTSSFAHRLAASGGSLLVSTYQAGRLVCARVRGNELNTHFRAFDKPMGMALGPGRLALGTRTEVWDLRDMPEVAAKLDPPGSHDACFLPRNRHVTGDIAVHEMAFAGGELWVVATAFSCLATLDADHSFVPRWKPPFVTAIAPGDRCHLNGLAVVGDEVRYVTALGTSDEPGGWRSFKAFGGVLVDVPSEEIVASGLSMPHSPRWHGDNLWVLASGRGELCRVDIDAGRTEVVAELPGFTRGLAFHGRTAFVGLSQIRESSTFGDLPLTKRLKERMAGVWAVDLDSGRIEGFLRFEDLVQEVFDIAFLPGRRWPEVAEPDSPATATSFALP